VKKFYSTREKKIVIATDTKDGKFTIQEDTRKKDAGVRGFCS
jgi:hypothetical protein